MKISGHGQSKPDAGIEFVDLEEITIEATPVELHMFAEFLVHTAGEMERMGRAFGHLHLADVKREFESSLHVTVFRADQ